MTPVERYRNKHKALGLCVSCSNTALPGTTLCGLCTSKNRQGCREYYRKKKEEHQARDKKRRDGYRRDGRCIICGRDLDPEVDGGNVTCTYCTVKSREVR